MGAESVNALVYGLKRWNGTVVVVSHDSFFLRSLSGSPSSASSSSTDDNDENDAGKNNNNDSGNGNGNGNVMKFYAICPQEGKIRRIVNGGIDSYLKSFFE